MVITMSKNKEALQNVQYDRDFSRNLLFVIGFIIVVIAGIVIFSLQGGNRPNLGFDVAESRSADGILSIQEVTAKNGVKAWLTEDHSVPVIVLKFAFKGAGSSIEAPDKQGLVQLTSNTIDEGAGDLDSIAFQNALQDRAIKLSFSATRDSFSGELKTLVTNKDRAFELLRLALTEPRFDEEPYDRMRQANLSRIRNSLAKPSWDLARLAYDTAFPEHPYGQNSGGTMTTLQDLTPGDSREFVKDYLTLDRLYVSASGSITPQELRKTINSVFGSLPASGKDGPVISEVSAFPKMHVHHDRDIPQTLFQIWQKGIAREDDENYYASIILAEILGGGFGSRLMESVREEAGLTYGIYAYLNNFDFAQALVIGTSTSNNNAPDILEKIRTELDIIKSDGVTEEEITEAVMYLTGSLPLKLTSNEQIARAILGLQLDGLPIDYLDRRQDRLKSVGVEDVQRVAEKLLDPDEFLLLTVGRPEGLEPDRIVEELPNVY